MRNFFGQFYKIKLEKWCSQILKSMKKLGNGIFKIYQKTWKWLQYENFQNLPKNLEMALICHFQNLQKNLELATVCEFSKSTKNLGNGFSIWIGKSAANWGHLPAASARLCCPLCSEVECSAELNKKWISDLKHQNLSRSNLGFWYLCTYLGKMRSLATFLLFYQFSHSSNWSWWISSHYDSVMIVHQLKLYFDNDYLLLLHFEFWLKLDKYLNDILN